MGAYYGPAGVVLGVIVAIVGGLLQIAGATPWVFCSVIGIGLVLLVAGLAVWLVHAMRNRKPSQLAA